MAILTKGQTFTTAESVTSTKLNNLVDAAAFVAGSSGSTDDTSLEVNGSGRLQIKDLGITSTKIAVSAITTAKILNSNITTAKIESSSSAATGVTYSKLQYVADMKVIGNVSGGLTSPSEVSILDENDMASDSATSLATQQSIKAYVDASSGIAYVGGESSTLPNGMIIKNGTTSISPNTTATVTFAVAFPTSCVNIQTTFASTSDISSSCAAVIVSASAFSLRNSDGSTRNIYWSAIGY